MLMEILWKRGEALPKLSGVVIMVRRTDCMQCKALQSTTQHFKILIAMLGFLLLTVRPVDLPIASRRQSSACLLVCKQITESRSRVGSEPGSEPEYLADDGHEGEWEASVQVTLPPIQNGQPSVGIGPKQVRCRRAITTDHDADGTWDRLVGVPTPGRQHTWVLLCRPGHSTSEIHSNMLFYNLGPAQHTDSARLRALTPYMDLFNGQHLTSYATP